jgi:hypothetical protein
MPPDEALVVWLKDEVHQLQERFTVKNGEAILLLSPVRGITLSFETAR